MSALRFSPPGLHVHAPRPSRVTARDDGDCPALARDGRKCRGRRFVLKFTEWYGLRGMCYHCGAIFGDDGCQTPGRENVERVRREWYAAQARADAVWSTAEQLAERWQKVTTARANQMIVLLGLRGSSHHVRRDEGPAEYSPEAIALIERELRSRGYLRVEGQPGDAPGSRCTKAGRVDA